MPSCIIQFHALSFLDGFRWFVLPSAVDTCFVHSVILNSHWAYFNSVRNKQLKSKDVIVLFYFRPCIDMCWMTSMNIQVWKRIWRNSKNSFEFIAGSEYPKPQTCERPVVTPSVQCRAMLALERHVIILPWLMTSGQMSCVLAFIYESCVSLALWNTVTETVTIWWSRMATLYFVVSNTLIVINVKMFPWSNWM